MRIREAGRKSESAQTQGLNGKTLVAAVVIVLLGFGLRFYGLGFKGLWGDEIAQAAWSAWEWATLWSEFRAPPDFVLTFALLHWVQGIGTNELFVRLPSAAASLLCVPLTFVIARRMTDTTTALLAMLLIAVAPYQVWYAQDARMYAPLACCAMVSLYFFLRLAGNARGGVLFAAVGLTLGNVLALYTHLFGVFPMVIEGTLALGLVAAEWLRTRRVTVPRWVGWVGLSFVVTGLLALPLAEGTIPYVLAGSQPAVAESIAPSLPFQFTWDFLYGLVEDFGLGAGEFSRTLIVLVAALFGFGILVRKKQPAAWSALVWLGLPLVVLAVVKPRHAVAARYLIFMQPLFLFLAAYGVVCLARLIFDLPAGGWATMIGRWRPAIVSCLGAALLLWMVAPPLNALYGRAKLNDWRAAAQFLLKHAEAGDLVFGERNTPNMNALSYYLPNILRFSTPPTTFEAMNAALEARRRMWYLSVGDYFDKQADPWARATLTEIAASEWHDPNLLYRTRTEFQFPQSEPQLEIYYGEGEIPSVIRYAGKQGFSNNGAELVRLNPQDVLEAKLRLEVDGPRVMELIFSTKKPAQFDVVVDGEVLAQVRETEAEKGERLMRWELKREGHVVLVQVRNQNPKDPLFVQAIALRK